MKSLKLWSLICSDPLSNLLINLPENAETLQTTNKSVKPALRNNHSPLLPLLPLLPLQALHPGVLPMLILAQTLASGALVPLLEVILPNPGPGTLELPTTLDTTPGTLITIITPGTPTIMTIPGTQTSTTSGTTTPPSGTNTPNLNLLTTEMFEWPQSKTLTVIAGTNTETTSTTTTSTGPHKSKLIIPSKNTFHQSTDFK